MNSMVIDAVTTPSTTHAEKVDRVNAAARGRTMTSIRMPAQASLQPRRTLDADAVDQGDGDRQADLHTQHRPHRHEGAGAGLVVGHHCIERHPDRSRPRDFSGHTVRRS